MNATDTRPAPARTGRADDVTHAACARCYPAIITDPPSLFGTVLLAICGARTEFGPMPSRPDPCPDCAGITRCPSCGYEGRPQW